MRNRRGEVGLGSLVAIIGVVVFLLLIPTALTILSQTQQTLPGTVNTDELGFSYILFKTNLNMTCVKNGSSSRIEKLSSDCPDAIQYAIWALNGTGGSILFKKGIYYLPVDTLIYLASDVSLISHGAIISTPTQNYITTSVFQGNSIYNVTISGFLLDGEEGTETSISEAVSFFLFSDSINIIYENNIEERISGRGFAAYPAIGPNSHIVYRNNRMGITDGGSSGGAGPCFDDITYGIIEGNIGYFWDSGPLIARSNHILIQNNMFKARAGVGIDCIIQTSTDVMNDIQIIGNTIIGPEEAAGQAAIAIHDTGSSLTSGVFKNISVCNNMLSRSYNGPVITCYLSQPIQGLQISHNTIIGAGANRGIAFFLISDQSGIIITDNVISNLDYGIDNTPAGPVKYMNATVFENNIITDVVTCLQGRFTNSTFVGNILGDYNIGSQVSDQLNISIFMSYLPFSNNIIMDNQLKTKGSGVYFYYGPDSSNKVRSNTGYITENSGTAVIENTNSSVIVSHGLAKTPSKVIVTGSTSDTNALFVDTIGTNEFTINAVGAVGGDRTVYWYAEV